MNPFKRLGQCLGPYRKDLILAAVMVMVETAFELVIPVLMAAIIDEGVANRDVELIFHQGILMGICALISLLSGLLYARYAARASYGLGARIREAEYEAVQRFSFANLDHFDTSSLVTRMTTDVTVIQNAINVGCRAAVRSP